MGGSVEYVYYEGPRDELVRDLKTDGDEMALDMEVFENGEWVPYYGNPSDLVPLDQADALERIRDLSA